MLNILFLSSSGSPSRSAGFMFAFSLRVFVCVCVCVCVFLSLSLSSFPYSSLARPFTKNKPSFTPTLSHKRTRSLYRLASLSVPSLDSLSLSLSLSFVLSRPHAHDRMAARELYPKKKMRSEGVQNLLHKHINRTSRTEQNGRKGRSIVRTKACDSSCSDFLSSLIFTSGTKLVKTCFWEKL